MARWALIADDLTGALDTGLQFRKVGLRTLVSTRPTEWPPDDDVIAISTESRHVEPAEAQKRVGKATRDLWFAQPKRIYKKTDSLLRGNIGPELEALLGMTGVQAVVYTPAFPAGGRTTLEGVHRLGGEPVAEASPGRDAVAPVRESHIPTLIGATSELRAKSVPLELVRAGAETLAKAFQVGADADINVLVPDIETDQDLEAVAEAMGLAGLRRICAGSAGLAEHLARASQVPETASRLYPRAQQVAAIVGTPNEHTQRQVRCLEASAATERIPLPAGPAAIEAAVHRVWQAWRGGRYVLFDAVVPGKILTPEEEAAWHQQIALLAGVLRREVSDLGLILTGGDTALAAFEGMQAETVELREEIEWGVPYGITTRGPGRGILVVTKGGTMGGEGALLEAFRHIGPADSLGPARSTEQPLH